MSDVVKTIRPVGVGRSRVTFEEKTQLFTGGNASLPFPVVVSGPPDAYTMEPTLTQIRPKCKTALIAPAGGGSFSSSTGASISGLSAVSGWKSWYDHGCAAPPMGAGFAISVTKR